MLGENSIIAQTMTLDKILEAARLRQKAGRQTVPPKEVEPVKKAY
jgi:hypothetical protein